MQSSEEEIHREISSDSKESHTHSENKRRLKNDQIECEFDVEMSGGASYNVDIDKEEIHARKRIGSDNFRGKATLASRRIFGILFGHHQNLRRGEFILYSIFFSFTLLYAAIRAAPAKDSFFMNAVS